jgi:hypothetical protein
LPEPLGMSSARSSLGAALKGCALTVTRHCDDLPTGGFALHARSRLRHPSHHLVDYMCTCGGTDKGLQMAFSVPCGGHSSRQFSFVEAFTVPPEGPVTDLARTGWTPFPK